MRSMKSGKSYLNSVIGYLLDPRWEGGPGREDLAFRERPQGLLDLPQELCYLALVTWGIL